MTDYKAVFFDIDHTLFSHSQHRIPESTWQALRELRRKGIMLFIATGRQYGEMHVLDEDWSFFDGFVTLNGTLTLDRDGETIISAFPIEGEARKSVERLFYDRTLPLLIVEKERMYANMHDEAVEKAQAFLDSPLPVLADIDPAEPIYQLIFYAGEGREEGIMSLFPGCVGTRWNDFAFDCISALGGKDKGVAAMMAHYGWTVDQCIVFGDGGNDVSMLAACPSSVAMGNGRQEAKDAASFVTKDIDEGGVAWALEHFGVL